MAKTSDIERFVYRSGKGLNWQTASGTGERLARVIDAPEPTESVDETLRRLEARVNAKMVKLGAEREYAKESFTDLDVRIRDLAAHYRFSTDARSKRLPPMRMSVARKFASFVARYATKKSA